MKKLQQGIAGYVLLVWLAIVLIGGGGWVANIVKLADMGLDHISGMLVVRVAGIFVPPLGAVLGFI